MTTFPVDLQPPGYRLVTQYRNAHPRYSARAGIPVQTCIRSSPKGGMEETAEGHGLSELSQPRRDVPGGGGAEGRAALPLDKAGRHLSGDLLARDRGGHQRAGARQE